MQTSACCQPFLARQNYKAKKIRNFFDNPHDWNIPLNAFVKTPIQTQPMPHLVPSFACFQISETGL
jgi:hypothetical protein